MDLVGILALAIQTVLPPVQGAPDFPGSAVWRATWGELDLLARSAPGSAERRRIAAELEAFQARRARAARKRHDRSEAFRARVLGAHLALRAGSPFRPVAEPGVTIAWLPGEGWIAAQVAAPGPTRVAAIEVALDEALPEALLERVPLAFVLASSDARDLRLDWALEVARALHARVHRASPGDLPLEHRSGVRSAGLLAFVSRLRGEHAAAVSVLENQLESTGDPSERRQLLVDLVRARLAAGQDALAVRDLGEALALGSADARSILGRFALADDAVLRARALFRSLIEEAPRPTPALRGYGLSLLTDAESSGPSTRNLPDTPR